MAVGMNFLRRIAAFVVVIYAAVQPSAESGVICNKSGVVTEASFELHFKCLTGKS